MTFDQLKQYVGARLDELTTLSVYGKMPGEEKAFPYLVYKFPSSSYQWNDRNDWIVEIDYWDNKQDSTTILAAAEAVKTGFNLYWQSEITGFYRSDLIFAGEIPDTNPNISRFQQRYLLKVR
ncbi:MAG: hypothetical protein A3K77_06345 [Euryarchaeota archaeon RBG_13_31_8]|nr:MAG: hypothetical protein A3K77_06345 [Euryarchaeota archaeon RBG_13_31_8]